MALGCATHSYAITSRDGGHVAASGVLTDVSWSRVINDVSTASVTIGVSGPGCCAELGNIRSWAQTLNIWRNTTFGSTFVWSGPIIGVDWSRDEVQVSAVDILGWLDRRWPHQNMTFTNTDLADIAKALIDDGYAPDDPGHTVTIIGPAGVTGGRTYTTAVGQTGDWLRDLAKTGIDFTAVGNNIVILPDGFCDVVGRLADQDMPEGMTVTEDGASLGTSWTVSNGATPAIVGTAGGTDPYYGLLEIYTEDQSVTDAASAQAAAQAQKDASGVVPVFINTQNVTLSPTADVDLLSLVPGWCVDITTGITCRTITQRLKITGLQVTEDGGSGDTPGQERIVLNVAAQEGS